MAIQLTNPMNGDVFKAELEKALDKTGDTMSGSLILAKNPTDDMEAATKEYVDTNIKKIALSGFTWVNKDISIGKIPNWTAECANKYVPIFFKSFSDTDNSSGNTVIKWDVWNCITYYGRNDIKISSTTGEIYFSEEYMSEYIAGTLFLFPVETINLI